MFTRKFFNIYLLIFTAYCIIVGVELYRINQNSTQLNIEAEKIFSDFQIKRHAISEMSEATKIRLIAIMQILGSDDEFEHEEIKESFYQQGSRFMQARETLLAQSLSERELVELQKIV